MPNKGVVAKTFFTLLLSSFGRSSSVQVDSGTLLGCSPPEGSLYDGFDISYYHYPLKLTDGTDACYYYDDTYTQEEYQYGGYVTYGGGIIGQSSGVTNLSFYTNLQSVCSYPVSALLPDNYHYDQQLTLTNFSMLITGYFYAQKTGEYKFNIDYVDDLTYLNIGAGKAFGCCQKDDSVSNPSPFDLSLLWPDASNSATTTLLGGYYYPLRIFFINRQGIGALEVSFTDPDGVVHLSLIHI